VEAVLEEIWAQLLVHLEQGKTVWLRLG